MLPSAEAILTGELARLDVIRINPVIKNGDPDPDFKGAITLVDKDDDNAGQLIDGNNSAVLCLVKPEDDDRRPMNWMEAHSKVMARLVHRKAKTVSMEISDDADAYGAALGICLELLIPGILKTKKKYNGPSSIDIKVSEDQVADFERGLAAGRMAMIQRVLGLMPRNVLRPYTFMNLISSWDAFASNDGSIEVWDLNEDQSKERKFGLLAAVGHNMGHMAMIKIMPANKSLWNLPPVVVPGKGLTFDSGGYKLKPPKSQDGMDRDMMGGAAAFAAADYIAQRREQLSRPVVILIPICENLIGTECMCPGDVYEAYNGMRVQIYHTDAEGRVVLAGAVSYAALELNPKYIVTVATLTGGAVVAMGDNGYTAVMCDDPKIVNDFVELGWAMCDPCQPLPNRLLGHDPTQCTVADVTNLHPSGKSASTISAFLFLNAFVKHKPEDDEKSPEGEEASENEAQEAPVLVHLDIAARAGINEKVPNVAGPLVIAEWIMNLD